MNALLTANAATQGIPYLCLDFATQVFSVPNKYYFATEAWKATRYKHSSTEPLPNVSVPVWFNWSGTVEGVYKDWGHVAVWFPGKGVLSSPFTRNLKQQWFDSPAKLIAYLGSGSYVGWSEDINDVRVAETVKEEAVYPNENDVEMVLADRGVVAGDAEKSKWANNQKFRWPEFWKDVRKQYPTPYAVTPDFVEKMCKARGFTPSDAEKSKWTGWLPTDFLNDLVKQYPDIKAQPEDNRIDQAKSLAKQIVNL